MKLLSQISPILMATLFYVACKPVDKQPLPKLGNVVIENGDTIYHTVGQFNLLNQDSLLVDNSILKGNIYISDFFFLNCPTICPKVMKQMLRLYIRYEDNPTIKLVSHTLDPKRDTPSALKQYATNLDVDHSKWLFLTGNKDHIYDIKNDYFIAATEDSDVPGGITHSGQIILVDKEGHVRSFAEGTDPLKVEHLIEDIDKLIQEYDDN